MNYAQHLAERSIALDIPVYSWDEIEQNQEEENYELTDYESEYNSENEESHEELEEDDEDNQGGGVKCSRIVMRKIKDAVMSDMAALLYASEKIVNLNKLRTDLTFVERRSTCAIGCGIVLPHVRTMQAKTLAIGFARYKTEFDFDAPDQQNVQIFIPMVAPTYDDKLYLRLYRSIAKAILETDVKEKLLAAQRPSEVIYLFNEYFR
jgi:mannitol/fructose-specific phosphotransferase system IIA component (Ntr-type)